MENIFAKELHGFIVNPIFLGWRDPSSRVGAWYDFVSDREHIRNCGASSYYVELKISLDYRKTRIHFVMVIILSMCAGDKKNNIKPKYYSQLSDVKLLGGIIKQFLSVNTSPAMYMQIRCVCVSSDGDYLHVWLQRHKTSSGKLYP